MEGKCPNIGAEHRKRKTREAGTQSPPVGRQGQGSVPKGQAQPIGLGLWQGQSPGPWGPRQMPETGNWIEFCH